MLFYCAQYIQKRLYCVYSINYNYLRGKIVYLKEAGIALFREYITNVGEIRDDVVEKLKKNLFGENVGGAKLVIGQCDAAIAMTTDLLNHLPLHCPENAGFMTKSRYAANNTTRLIQLGIHLRPNGSYPRNYAILNGGSSAWAVGIVNSEGRHLAEITKTLVETLSGSLSTYLQFDRDQATGAIIPPLGFQLMSFEPEQILQSAIRQMAQSTQLWDEHFSRNASEDEAYIHQILKTLEPNPFKIGIAPFRPKYNPTELFLDTVGLDHLNPQLGQDTPENLAKRQYYVDNLNKYRSEDTEEEKSDIEKTLNNTIKASLRELAQDLTPKGGFTNELRTLKHLVLQIYDTEDEVEKNKLKIQLGLELAKRKNYLLDLGRVTNSRYNAFPKLDTLNALHSCTIIVKKRYLQGILKDPKVIEGFLEYNAENPVEKLMQLIKNLRGKLELYQKNHPKFTPVQNGKIAILDQLIARLELIRDGNAEELNPRLPGFDLRVRPGELKEHQFLFTAVIKTIGLAISNHNVFVEQNGTALGSTNDILQDFLSEAIDFLNGYTIGSNTAFRGELMGALSGSALENQDQDPKHEGEEKRDSDKPSLSGNRNALFQGNEAPQGSLSNSNPESSSLGAHL